MSRSDGSFPKFVRIEVDPDEWPNNYWDNSFKCSTCATSWPHVHLFNPSICCGAPVTKSNEAPEFRWPDALVKLHTAHFEHFYEEWNEGKSDEDLPFEDLKTLGILDENKVDAAIAKLETDINMPNPVTSNPNPV